MASLMDNNTFALVYRQDSRFKSHTLCLIDVKHVIQSVERLTNVRFPPENIDHLPSEMIHRVTTDFLHSCLSTIERTDRSELRIKRLLLTVEESRSISQKDVDPERTGSEDEREETHPSPEHSVQNILHRRQDEDLLTPLDTGGEPVTGVDDQETCAISDTCQTVACVDSYQKVAHSATCSSEPMVPVDGSCPKARVDTCQPVTPVDSCQPMVPVDSRQPVAHVDSDQPIVSGVNSHQPMAHEEIDQPMADVNVNSGQPLALVFNSQSVAAEGHQTVKMESDLKTFAPAGSSENLVYLDICEPVPPADKGKTPRRRKEKTSLRVERKVVTAMPTEPDVHVDPVKNHSQIVSDQSKRKTSLAKKIDRGMRRKAEKNICPECSKEFTSKQNLANHMRSHKGERSFQCEICGMAFMIKKTLKQHMKTVHSKDKPFQCSMCGKSFPIKVYLITHMRVHSGEKPHTCEICGKSFSLKSGLKQHIRIHTNEKPYQCAICGKMFGQRSGLIKHFSGHEEQRQFWYRCEVCNKTFPVKEKFEVHKRLHTGEKPYLCDNCGKGFASSAYLAQHRKIHNTMTYQCANCGRSYSWAHTLQQHSKTCVLNDPLAHPNITAMENVLLQPSTEMESQKKEPL